MLIPDDEDGDLPLDDGLELDGLELELELDGLEVLPLALELDGLEELMPLELEPLELDFWPASHSERLICPSWFLSSLSNSALELEDDVPPAAELDGEVELDVPPEEDDDGEDDLLLCDVEGELAPLEELFDVSLA